MDGIKKWRVACQRRIEYEVACTSDLFSPDNPALLSGGRVCGARRFVVVDANVERLHSSEIRGYFAHHGVEARVVAFAGGEANKTMESWLSILRELDGFPINRRDEPVIAIGGGVLMDLVGFSASVYRRGVPYIRVPTTLMGYVDAAVGVKTGLDFNGHKNRLGAFQPPLAVLLDRAFLGTLTMRHVLNGMAEIVKLAVIRDAELFAMLEDFGADSAAARFQDEAGDLITRRAITGMAEELQPDPFEEDLARRVDFGHTFCYGFQASDAGLLHGEAVALDIAVSVLIARSRGLLSEEEAERALALFWRLGMRLHAAALDPELMWESLEERVRHRNGAQRMPLPHGIGGCAFINDLGPEEIFSAVRGLKIRMAARSAAGVS